MTHKKVFNDYKSFKLDDGTFVEVTRTEQSVELIVQRANKNIDVQISAAEAEALRDGLSAVYPTNRAQTETQILAEQVRYGMSRLRHPSNHQPKGQP